jgi:hypothetical protein
MATVAPDAVGRARMPVERSPITELIGTSEIPSALDVRIGI